MFFSRNIGQLCTVFALVIACSYAQNAFAQNAVPVPLSNKTPLTNATYGEGANEIYYKWGTNSDGTEGLIESDRAAAEVTVKYDTNLGIMSSPNGPSDINGKGDFVGNDSTSVDYFKGGAVTDPNGDITANFFSNTSADKGGAIKSDFGVMGDIAGDFVNNRTGFLGGAIFNGSRSAIQSVTGEFISNNVVGQYRAEGGAIWSSTHTAYPLVNEYKINTLNSNFVGNYTLAKNDIGYAESLGGAIANYGSSGMSMEDMSEIYMYSKIGEINGDFTNNYAKAVSSASDAVARGGAIYNTDYGIIEKINGNFTGNYAEAQTKDTLASALGGAIFNAGVAQIGTIKGNFTDNYVSATIQNIPSDASYKFYAQGGAIYNGANANISSIEGDFVHNGIILNTGIDNYRSVYYGGAIFNAGNIDSIKGNFSQNYVGEENQYSFGGAISNYFNGTIGTIEGNFENNSSKGYDGVGSLGGAISNQGRIDTIKGTFTGNTADYGGGAIANTDHDRLSDVSDIKPIVIDSIEADFNNNSAKYHGGAIYNLPNSGGKINSIKGSFTGNNVSGSVYSVGGGALYAGSYGDIDADFTGNYAEIKDLSTNTSNATVVGGAIDSGSIDNLTGTFTDNYVYARGYSAVAQGGAIFSTSVKNEIKADFSGNHATAKAENGSYFLNGKATATGGAVSSQYDWSKYTFINSSFTNNYAEAISQTGEARAKGGAIFATTDLTIKADNGNSLFSGNKTIETSNGITKEDANAIYMGKYIGTYDNLENYTHLNLNLNAVNDGTIQFDDKIAGGVQKEDWGMEGTEITFIEGSKHYYNLNINGDSTGKVILNNDIINAKVTLDNTNLVMGREDIFDKSNSLTLNSGTVDMQNGQAGTVSVPELNINGNINVKVDADLSGAGSMDNFGSANINGNGSVIIDSINIVKDMDEGVYSTVLDFLNHNSVSTSLNVPGGSLMTSLYTYYLGMNDNKQIIFERTEDLGGFASAIANKPPVTDYYITMEKEVINGWSAISGSEMQGNELNVHGNGNSLDGNGNKGISIGAGKTMNIENVGKLVITETDETNPNAFQAFDKNGELKYYTTEGTTGWQNFVNNQKEEFGGIEGGAIRNSGNLSINNVIFIDNHVYSSDNSDSQSPSGGAIYNDHTGVIENISGAFINNSAEALPETTSVTAFGGAIFTAYGEIKNIDADFIGNNVKALAVAQGGAIFNGLGNIGNITGNFINNYVSAKDGSYDQGYTYVASGGAIYNNSGNIGDINANFIGNYASSITQTANNSIAQGGAIVHQGQSDRTIGSRDENGNVVGGIVNSNFINNYAIAESAGENASAKGGAIYTTGNLNIIADNGSSVFSGNKTVVTINKGTENEQTIETPNAIYVDADMIMHPDETVELTLKSVNNGVIRFEDQIDGSGGYGLNITGDATGKVLLNNSVKNANVTVDTVNLNLGKNDVFATSDVTMTSGTLGFINNTAEAQTMQSLNINGNVNLALDVDLAGEKMDTLPDGTVVSSSSQIGVSYLNLLNDAVKDKTIIAFAPEDYANQIQYTGENPIAYSKIYKYDVGYQINPDSNLGEFIFARGSSSNASDNFNPSVLPAPVTTQTGGYTTQLQTFNYAFQHSDSFMNIPYLDRMAMKNRNKYALSPTGDATDMGVYSPLFTKDESAGFWIKPYASFESVPLKNGPSVSNINYGTLVGYDSTMKSIANGFDRVITGYIGYNGASQRYSGVDAYQNGGLLGSTITLYKGNFFNATTASVGATVGDATGMYGSENYTMLLAGIANKTGYNFEFMKGKVILQPSMMISYSFVNTFDYTNAAGLRIKADPLNAIQLSPGLKLIGNTKNGWQPYIGVNMVWNLLDKTKVTADDVRLPEMSIKPYVQYGVGVQKRFGESATGYAQAMIHNGGRNGVSLSAGFRWAVGKKK